MTNVCEHECTTYNKSLSLIVDQELPVYVCVSECVDIINECSCMFCIMLLYMDAY